MKDPLNRPIDNLLPYNGEVFYHKDFFTEAESDLYFKDLLNGITWKQEPIKIFGKEIMQPRLTAWFGDKDYSYSGITMRSAAFPPPLAEIKEQVTKISGAVFNSALLNLYRSGKDSMGWHRDHEKELGINPVIASVSLGAAREFRLRDYNDKKISITIRLEPGSLLLMRAETQHHWEHSIAKTAENIEPRINITFRNMS